MQQSQMTGLTTGTFDSLYVKVPPDQDLVNVASTIFKVDQLDAEANIQNQNLEALQADVTQLQTDVDSLETKQGVLDNEIQTKQNILTARFPLRIHEDVISLGFLSTADAEDAAIARAGHLQATESNTTNVTELQSLVADQATLIQQLRADVDSLLPPPPGSDYIELNGTTSYLKFDSGFDDVFDWTKSFSVGVDLYTLPDETGNNLKASLFSSGGSFLTLHRQSPPASNANWGSYNTCNSNLYNVTGRANANTWSSPLPTSRLLYSFDHTTQKLKYYIGEKGGSYAQKASISIPDTFATVQQLGSGLEFGMPFSGTGGANFSSNLWMGGVGDMLISKHAWNTAQVAEYFAVADKDFSTLSYYGLEVYAWLKPGTYPALVDAKGNVPDGALINGSATDFKDE